MTITLPVELEHKLHFTAQKRQTSVDVLVRQALEWYLRIEPELMDELEAWQQVRDEAWLAAEEAEEVPS
jgi:predicted transcriptional regulator